MSLPSILFLPERIRDIVKLFAAAQGLGEGETDPGAAEGGTGTTPGTGGGGMTQETGEGEIAATPGTTGALSNESCN